MNIRYYDIGLNLFTPSFPDLEIIIEDAEAAGVRCILPGSDRKDNELVNDFTKKHGLLGTAGIHPHSTDTAREEDLQRIREIILTNPAIRRVGETGLDYDHMYAIIENQLYFFNDLIFLAL